jgi:hypothetical protein
MCPRSRIASARQIVRLLSERMTRFVQEERQSAFEHEIVRLPVSREWHWVPEGERIIGALSRSFCTGREIERIKLLWVNALLTGT